AGNWFTFFRAESDFISVPESKELDDAPLHLHRVRHAISRERSSTCSLRHLRGGAPIRPSARADLDHTSSAAADPHQHPPRIREGHYWHRLDARVRYRPARAARAH